MQTKGKVYSSLLSTVKPMVLLWIYSLDVQFFIPQIFVQELAFRAAVAAQNLEKVNCSLIKLLTVGSELWIISLVTGNTVLNTTHNFFFKKKLFVLALFIIPRLSYNRKMTNIYLKHETANSFTFLP